MAANGELSCGADRRGYAGGGACAYVSRGGRTDLLDPNI
jgi:hypothetical protein